MNSEEIEINDLITFFYLIMNLSLHIPLKLLLIILILKNYLNHY